MFDVTSWFVDQLAQKTSSPKRVLTIGTSDYSSRVTKWPTVRRALNDIRSTSITIGLENADGGMNSFFENTYTLPNSAMIQFGFTHPDSGDELIPMFTGNMIDVSYQREICNVKIRDNFWDFTQKVVGANNDPVTANTIPTDILWWLITSYGELSNVASTNNPAVDYTSYLKLAESFSIDNVTCQVRFEGEKVHEAVERVAKYLDIGIWVEGNGKIMFERTTVASDSDPILSDTIETRIDVQTQRLINKQYVDFDYDVDSDYWASRVFDQSTSSVNTFGLHENAIQDDIVWFTGSASAINIAQRKVVIYSDPPRKFTIDAPPLQIYHQLSDTFRFVDSFFNVSSEVPYRATELSFNMDDGKITWTMDGASVFNPFVLDVDSLDGTLKRLI